MAATATATATVTTITTTTMIDSVSFSDQQIRIHNRSNLLHTIDQRIITINQIDTAIRIRTATAAFTIPRATFTPAIRQPIDTVGIRAIEINNLVKMFTWQTRRESLNTILTRRGEKFTCEFAWYYCWIRQSIQKCKSEEGKNTMNWNAVTEVFRSREIIQRNFHNW